MTRSARWLLCLPIGLCLVASSAVGQEPTSDLAQVEAVAESIVAREEALSERAFDPIFRAKAKELLATLPLAELVAQTDEDGLGLSSLGDSQADLVYTPVTPCRIIDTRVAGGAITAGTTRNFLVTGTNYSAQGGKATSCGVPYGPTTVAVVNFVAVNPGGAGNLRVTPFGTAMPLASIINFSAGMNLANGLVVPTCNPSSVTCTSDITIQADVSATQLVADVLGYYQRVATGGVGTALLADAAVTAPKIGSGVVVRSLNSQTDAVTLAGSNGLSVTQGSGTVTVSSNATSANTGGAIVARDGSGNFAAGTVALAGNLTLPNTTSTTVGVLTQGGTPFLHNFGFQNTFVGSNAGNMSMTGSYNSAVGWAALKSNTTGYNNAAVGTGALGLNTTGYHNAAVGTGALNLNATGYSNAAVGPWALYANTSGCCNAAVGDTALFSNETGSSNSAFGYRALYANRGELNSAVGSLALGDNTTGSYNSAFGEMALRFSTTGSENVAIGATAGFSLTSGSYNIYIANTGIATESGAIRIGRGGTHTATYIAGIYTKTSSGGTAVYINSSDQLGTVPSSRRYKEQIADMDTESDVLMKLRPVSFYYRPDLDETQLRQYGLVAEEVADVAPGLVAYDNDGTPQTVRYHFVNAMLLNEVQKQRATIETQESRIRDLEARLAKLEAARGDQ
jgi:Chaperone of endosialidase